MTTEREGIRTTYTDRYCTIECTENAQFLLIPNSSENELFDNFEELVEAHPRCEIARSTFFEPITE